jgi:integrase/recombinase XerD
MVGGPMTNTGAAGATTAGANASAKTQPRSANFKGTNGNRWSVGKDHPGMTWDESLAGFLRSRRLGIDGASRAVKPRTIEEYEWDLGLFFDFLRNRGITHYNKLTEKIVHDYIEHLQSKERGKGGWSKATQRKYLISLKAFFHWVGLDQDCKDANMVSFFTSLPRIGKEVRREFIPSQEQMERFRKGFDKNVIWGLRDWTVLTLMLDTGARVGEVCNLEEVDIHWDNCLVNLDGKTGKRLVPFDPDSTGRALRHWLAVRTKYAHPACKKVFVSRYGGNCSPNTFAQSFSDNLKKIKLDTELGDNTISCHTVRHYFCTMYLVHGGTLHNLQRITGHKTMDTLMLYVNLAQQLSTVQEEHSRVSPLKHMNDGQPGKKRVLVRL